MKESISCPVVHLPGNNDEQVLKIHFNGLLVRLVTEMVLSLVVSPLLQRIESWC